MRGFSFLAVAAVSTAIAVDAAQAEFSLKPGDTFRDLDVGPEMVVVPAGSFTMGSPETEERRDTDEGPQHTVTFATPFAVGKFEVTRREFAAFVAATGYIVGNSCWIWDGGHQEETSGKSWRDPGYAQTDDHPAACLSFNDAEAYVAWLSRETGHDYRLLSEAEWEYAARGRTEPGAYPRFSFGENEADLCDYGNAADRSTFFDWRNQSCSDGVGEATAPAGGYRSNAFGLYDMIGNVWEWTEDCYEFSYAGAPVDGSAMTSEACDLRVLRGGSWSIGPGDLRAADRNKYYPNFRTGKFGFRVARTL